MTHVEALQNILKEHCGDEREAFCRCKRCAPVRGLLRQLLKFQADKEIGALLTIKNGVVECF